MEWRGWLRGSAEDNGMQVSVLRELPGGRTVVLSVDPNQGTHLGRRAEARLLRFSELDAITASEVLADVVELTTA